MVDITPWSTTTSASLSKSSALGLLRCELLVNQVIFGLTAVHILCYTDAEDDCLKRAGAVVELKVLVQETIKVLSQEAGPLCEAPLHRSIPVLRTWAAAVETFNKLTAEEILQTSTRHVMARAAAVDQLCPRWGESITDHSMNDDAAKVQLIFDNQLSQLPDACRLLHDSLVKLGKVGTVLGVPGGVEKHITTREFVRSGRLSLSFGKRTVNVSAAVRMVFNKPLNRKGIAAMLGFKSSLPGALVRKLETAMETSEGDASLAANPAAASASGTMVPSAPSGPSSGSGIKRSRSATALGSSSAKSARRSHALP